MDGKWLIQQGDKNEYFDDFESAKLSFLESIRAYSIPEVILHFFMETEKTEEDKRALELLKEKILPKGSSHYKYIRDNEKGECVALIISKENFKVDYYYGELNYYLHTNAVKVEDSRKLYEFDYSDNQKKYRIKLGYLSNDDLMVIKAFGKNYELGLPVFEYCDDSLSEELKEKAKWHKFKE